jgi:ABC-type branched-subunit amino acid transport system substrate-binding protein
VLKQLRETGIAQQLYTNEFAAAGDILKDYPKQIEGAIYAEPAFDEAAPKSKELLEKFKSTYGSLPGSIPPVYLATSYDSLYIVADALTACGEDTNCIKSNLYSIKDRSGTAGTLTIDENGDAQVEYVVKTIQNNTPAAIS